MSDTFENRIVGIAQSKDIEIANLKSQLAEKDREIKELETFREDRNQKFFDEGRDSMKEQIALRDGDLKSAEIELRARDEQIGKLNSNIEMAQSEIKWRDEKIGELKKVLLETRNASAALCRLIVSKSPELLKELPYEFDGFGKRADEALGVE